MYLTVRVKLVQSARLPPNHSNAAEARPTNSDGHGGPLLIEPNELIKKERGIQTIDSLVSTCDEGTVNIMLTNCSNVVQKTEAGVEEVGSAIPSELVDLPTNSDNVHSDSASKRIAPTVSRVCEWSNENEGRKQQLIKTLEGEFNRL